MKGVIPMKKVHTYLPENTARMITENARAEHLSKSSYSRAVILRAIRSLNEGAVCNGDVSEAEMYKPIHVHFGGKEAVILQHKAARLHLNQTGWVQNILLRKNRKIYHMELDDLGMALEQCDRLERAITAVRSAGWKQKSFRYDLELLSDYTNNALEYASILLEEVFKKRQKEQKRLIRRYTESYVKKQK